MTIQAQQNHVVALKAQAGLGTPASGASGIGFRYAKGSQGLRLLKNDIMSQEVRKDGQTTRGRHGSRRGTASYIMELAVGAQDTWLEALLRGTWTAAADITQAAMTSITTTTSTIVASGGSWLTQGVRKGDLVKLAGHATAANNGIWFRVVTVTASTITVAGTPLTADAVADNAFTLTIARTLTNGSTPTERYFTVDEYAQDLDRSKRGTDFKFCKAEIVAAPDQHVRLTVSMMGLDVDSQLSAASPILTSPTFSTTLPLVLADGTIRINGVDYADLTSLSISLDSGGEVPGVLAPNGPDVILGNMVGSGSVGALRSSFTHFDAFDAETQIDIFAHMVEAGDTDPKDFLSLYIGNATYGGNDDPIGGEGAMGESLPFKFGKDDGGSDRAATMIKFATSAA